MHESSQIIIDLISYIGQKALRHQKKAEGLKNGPMWPAEFVQQAYEQEMVKVDVCSQILARMKRMVEKEEG